MRFIWGMIRNPPMRWVGESGEHFDHFSRRDRWAILRPMWTYTILTTKPGCGCRRRLGLWRTIFCSEHIGLDF